MIRKKTILCKINQIKITDKQLLDSMVPSGEVCTGCGAKDHCHSHASYERDLITIMNGCRHEGTVSIQRVVCSSCGKTHALLADILIPHSSYSLRFVLHVLRAYLGRACTVAALCDRFSIAVSTLYNWIHLFNEHANLWLSALEQLASVSAAALDHMENIERLPSRFFARYRFSFLQNHTTTRYRPTA